jgi:hypothetical protein
LLIAISKQRQLRRTTGRHEWKRKSGEAGVAGLRVLTRQIPRRKFFNPARHPNRTVPIDCTSPVAASVVNADSGERERL